MQNTEHTIDLNDATPGWSDTKPAPTATQETQEDITTTYTVTYSKDGVACCSGKGE